MKNIPVIAISEKTLAEAYEEPSSQFMKRESGSKPSMTSRKTQRAWIAPSTSPSKNLKPIL